MSDQATIVDRNTLTLVRQLPGPIERVWAYLTDPKFLVKWFSDGIVADVVGGEVRFDMGATGRVTAFEPPHLLEYTWNELEKSRGPIVNSLVRWELSENANGVRLTLTHSRLSEIEVRFHSAGWHAFLHRLSAFVDGRAPEPLGELFARFYSEYGITPKVVVGNHASVRVPRSAQDGIRRFYRDVLGGTFTEQGDDKDVLRLGDNFFIPFLYGDFPDESDFLRTAKAVWLELKSDNVDEMRRKILDFGVLKLDVPDEHLYFQAPGGQVWRLVGIDEDLSKYEGNVVLPASSAEFLKTLDAR